MDKLIKTIIKTIIIIIAVLVLAGVIVAAAYHVSLGTVTDTLKKALLIGLGLALIGFLSKYGNGD